MNYKYSADDALPISILSYFHRGFFWGITCSWVVGFSFVMGATITKSAYIDRQNNQLANKKVLEKSLPKQLKLDTNKSSINDISFDIQELQLSFPQVAFIPEKFSSFLQQKYSKFKITYLPKKQTQREQIVSQKKQQEKYPDNSISKQEAINLESISDNSLVNYNQNLPPSTYVTNSTSQKSTLEKFSTINEITNFKKSRIIIYNSTNNPELATDISEYLQEREYFNIEISNFEITQGRISQQELTKIRTDGQNLKSANYLKNILGFGDLELLPSGFLNASEPSELIILLGSDAQVFNQNQDFVSVIR